MAQSAVEKMVRSAKNPRRFSDPNAQYFSDLWFYQAPDLSAEQLDKLGKAYLKHILGVNDEIIGKYVERKGNAENIIGMKMAGRDRKDDYSNYWKEVSEITEREYSSDDLEWLAKDAGDWGAYDFILTTEGHCLRYSPVLSQMSITAHVFK